MDAGKPDQEDTQGCQCRKTLKDASAGRHSRMPVQEDTQGCQCITTVQTEGVNTVSGVRRKNQKGREQGGESESRSVGGGGRGTRKTEKRGRVEAM